ncbi:MAG: HAD family hydrolase, partial [Muribaculaceae bacterium]
RRYSLDCFWPTERQWLDDYHVVNDELWHLYSRGEIARDVLRMERFRRPLASAGCAEAEAREMSAMLDGVYLALLGGMSGTVPGAHEVLNRLRPYYNIGILSNGFAEVQYGKMASAGLSPLIDCVVLSDEIEINKPDRRLFDYACRKAGTEAGRCLLVGDNPDTDIAGATGAGWKAVYFCPRTEETDKNLTDKEKMSGPRAELPEGVKTVCSLDQIEAGDDAENGLIGLNIKKST